MGAPEISVAEQIEAIRRGEISKEELPSYVAQLQTAIEEQRQRELTAERLPQRRREVIRERGIDSLLQRNMDMEPEW